MAFTFNQRRYLEMACEHDTALTLRSADLRASFDRGEFEVEWEQQNMQRTIVYANSLRGAIWNALRITALVTVLVLAACVVVGTVRPNLPASLQGCLVALSAILALWGGLLQTYPPIQSNKGVCLHEEVHSLLIKAFVVLAAAFGLFASLV